MGISEIPDADTGKVPNLTPHAYHRNPSAESVMDLIQIVWNKTGSQLKQSISGKVSPLKR